ncbi:BCS1 N terminal-domain-containing protein [Copromyces sp. CBS 386.78]|nr:BCS1 N terminal-domain-containing protein [Copromyces sp. CBS 386.78]
MNCYMLIIWALSTLVDASTDSGETINITTTTINDTTQAATVLLPDSLLASFSPMLDIYLPPAVRDFLVSCHRALTSWLGFDPTILLSLGPIVWAAKRLWSEVKVLVIDDIICNWFTARVEVGDDDPIFIHIMRWVAVQPSSAKTRFLQADTIAGSADDHDEDDEAGAVAAAGAAAVKNATSTTSTTTTTDPSNTNTTTKKKKQNPTLLPNGEVCLNFSTHKHQKPPRFLPAVNVPYTFSFGGTYFWLNRTRSHVAAQSEYRGLSMRKEENLVITCVGFSARPIKNFIQFTKEWNHSRQAATTVVRRPARPEMRSWGGRHVWAEVADRPIRPMDTVVLDEKQKLMVLQDMNEYLQRETAQWYGERGIPLRRGYLFHGPPGTGKTSLSFALAGVFGLDIFVISLLDQNLTEDDLAMLFTNLPRRCVVLLEDIDTAGLVNRGKEEESESSSETSDSDSEEGEGERSGSGASGSEDNDYLRSEKKRALQVLLLGDDLEKKKNRKGKKKGKVSAKQEALEKEVAERVAEFKQMLKEGSDEEKDGDKVTDEKVSVDREATEDKEKTPAESEEKPVSSADDAGEKDEKTTKSESEPATDKRKKKNKKPMTAKEKKAKKKQKIRKKNKAMATSVLHNLHNIEYIGRQYGRRRPSPYDRERGISLSGLLNAIDGVASHEGRVLIMTTNKPEKLDEALLRPGRVDLQIAFLNATQEQVRELFERMYEADVVDPATTAVTFTKVGNKLTASTTTTAGATTLPLVVHSPPVGITSPGSDTAAEKGDEEKQHQQQPPIVDPKIVDLKLLDDNNNNPRKSSVSSCSSDATAIGSEEDNAASPVSPNTSGDPNTNTPKTTDTTAAAAEKPQPQQPSSDEKKEEPPVPLHITPLTRSELQKIAKEFSLKIPATQILSPAEIQGFLLRRKKDPRRALAEVDKWVEELVKAKESKSKILDAKAI